MKLLIAFFSLLLMYHSFIFNKPYLFFLLFFFLISILIYKKNFFTNVLLIFFSIFLSLLAIDTVISKKKIKNVKIIPALSSFWEKKNIGYINKDINNQVDYFLNENLLFSVNYKIVNSLRVKNKKINNIDNCKKIIFLGGSHNFGAGLNFDETLQGHFDLEFHTVNFSTAGYGLNHSIWRIQDDINNKNLILNNCEKNDKFLFIYRYMFANGHIFRNLGLHSYDPNGPDFTNYRLKNYSLELTKDKNLKTKTYCSNFYGCFKYNFNYLIYRFSLMLSYSDSYFFNLISNTFYNLFILNNKNLDHTVRMTQVLEKLIKNNFPNSDLIVYIENYNFTDIKNKTYLTKNKYENKISNNLHEMLQKKGLNSIKTSDLSVDLCEALYIEYEGHPNKCHNKILYNQLIKFLKKISF